MKKVCSLLVFLPAVLLLQAQRYIIRYDLAGDDVKYYAINKRGDTTGVPVINLSRSNKINLTLQNLSGSFRDTIFYKIKAETNETIVNPFWGGDMVGTSGLAFLKKYTDKLYQQTDVAIKSNTDLDEAARKKVISDYNHFIDAYNNWTRAALFKEECKGLWKELAGLRYNIEQTAVTVKQTAHKKTADLFPGINENTTTIQVAEWLAEQDPARLKELLNKAYEKILLTYQELTFPNSQIDSLISSSKKLMNTANSYPFSTGEKNISETVNRIISLYRQIMKDSYVRTLPLTIERNTSAAIIKLAPVADSATRKLLRMPLNDTLERVITIYKKSPIRFRNTFGISFVSYAENRWNYFVKTNNNINTIEKESADIFLPVVTAFLHFYSPRDKGFRWGGSFGAGITLGGGENDIGNQLNILLGLSTFLGRNDPVCISAGISGARVKKLSGYRPGDVVSFQQLEEKHYNSVYRNGYYIGITFNPTGLNAKD